VNKVHEIKHALIFVANEGVLNLINTCATGCIPPIVITELSYTQTSEDVHTSNRPAIYTSFGPVHPAPSLQSHDHVEGSSIRTCITRDISKVMNADCTLNEMLGEVQWHPSLVLLWGTVAGSHTQDQIKGDQGKPTHSLPCPPVPDFSI
jgi:hypothetical protein